MASAKPCADEGFHRGMRSAMEYQTRRKPGVEYRVERAFNYQDENGAVLFRSVKLFPKAFYMQRPDGNGGWLNDTKGVRLVLYRLPDIMNADEVFVCEGEKDCETAFTFGLTATTNPMGAGKWRPEYAEFFEGKKVVIVADNDKPGMNHAQKVAASLHGKARSIKVIRFEDMPEKSDLTDFFNAHEDKTEASAKLAAMVDAAAIWEPSENGGASARTSRIELTRLSDLLREPEEQVDWVVDGLLPEGGFSVLAAKPKVGKSTLSRNLALKVARGEDFLGRVTNQGAVIYLALEEKRSEVRKHFREMGADGSEEIFIYAARAPEDALAQLRKLIEDIKPSLVIIDPLFKITRIKDGNDYAAVTRALEPILALARESGTHILCTHHTGKGDRQGGDSLLGSTAIFGNVDTAIIEKRLEKYRTLHSYQRYGADLEETTLHFNPETRTLSLGESRIVEDVKTVADAICEFLTAKGEPMTEPEINTEVEGKTTLKRKALRELVANNGVERAGAGTKGDPFRYSCSLVPYIYGEQGNKNLKSGLTSRPDDENSCSPIFRKTDSCSRETIIDIDAGNEHFQTGKDDVVVIEDLSGFST